MRPDDPNDRLRKYFATKRFAHDLAQAKLDASIYQTWIERATIQIAEAIELGCASPAMITRLREALANAEKRNPDEPGGA